MASCDKPTKRFCKTPDEVLDYKFDWSDWLQVGENIQTSTITVETGLTKDSTGEDTTSATVWLSGGTVDEDYTVVNKITTSNSPTRTAQRTMFISVVEAR